MASYVGHEQCIKCQFWYRRLRMLLRFLAVNSQLSGSLPHPHIPFSAIAPEWAKCTLPLSPLVWLRKNGVWPTTAHRPLCRQLMCFRDFPARIFALKKAGWSLKHEICLGCLIRHLALFQQLYPALCVFSAASCCQTCAPFCAVTRFPFHARSSSLLFYIYVTCRCPLAVCWDGQFSAWGLYWQSQTLSPAS